MQTIGKPRKNKKITHFVTHFLPLHQEWPRGPGCCQQRGRAGHEGCSSQPRPVQPSMELTGLLPVLAWLQLLPQLVSSQGTEGSGSTPDSQPPTPLPAPPAPGLSLSPPSPVRGQQVQLRCSAPRDSRALGFVFYEQRRGSWERLASQSSGTWRISTEKSELSRTFTCSYWVQSSPPRQPHSQSLQSNAVTLLLTEPPPQPALSVDPPSGVVSEGLPLLITCTAPGDASERRFHFYKDGAEIVPGDTGSEISTTEPSTGSVNFSVLSILRAGPSNTGEFSCGYEVNMSGRWIPSPRSQAVNVTVTATRRLSMSYWKRGELCRSWIARRSTEISGLNMCGVMAETHTIPPVTPNLPALGSEPQPCSAVPAPPLMFGSLSFRPVYVNIPFGASTALQQWSHDWQVQPVTHNQPAQPNNPGGKPGVGQNPQERVKREEDADATEGHNSLVSIPVYSMVTPSSATAQQTGGKYISEAVVYSEIPY
ncbi:uncharacterized protein ACDP82_014970 isoform 2-T2 [Pangshura tecta]